VQIRPWTMHSWYHSSLSQS